MTDRQRLRLQIQGLLGAAIVGAGALACEGASQAPMPETASSLPAPAPTPLPSSRAAASSPRPRPAPPETEAPVPGYLIGDPPFVEGWDPEEATCNSGNWCGPAAAAAVVVRVGMEKDLDPQTGCPKRLMGKKPGGVDPKLAVYRGLSDDRMMLGTFQPWRTAKKREAGAAADLCCYHWFDYCAGRPLDAGARSQAGRLAMQEQAHLHSCDGAVRALARAFWIDADDEYDSVAAFARASLELFALGAPAELVEASQRASLDEMEHARLCREISLDLYPHNWPARRPCVARAREMSLAQFLVQSFREGCVGESIASLRASRMAARSDRACVRQALERIAYEEGNHAALAWKIVAWGLEVGDPSTRELLAQAAKDTFNEIQGASQQEGPDAQDPRLSAEELRACTLDAWHGVVAPILEQVLAV